ncbi:unnamed protein product [Scytosiphon promiscuus]
MPVVTRARRDVSGTGGPAANERGVASGGNTGTRGEGSAESRCLEALVVAVHQASEIRRWYTVTNELQVASLQLCEACRGAQTAHLRVDGGIPASLLAAVDTPHAKPEGGVSSRVPRLRARRVRWLLPSLSLLCNATYTFAQLEELYIGDTFDRSLVPQAWPCRLTKIQFGVRSRFNQPIVEVVWPASLQKLSFGRRFNQPVEGVVWPASLEKLRFWDDFNQPIRDVWWPPSLQQLTFGYEFNRPIDGVVWPSSMLELNFLGKFNQPIDGVKWPIGLRLLTFGHAFNQLVQGITWPTSLRQLTFGFMFNRAITGVTWPTSLQQLTFGRHFNQPIDGVMWPPALEDLTFGENFNQPIQDVRWPSLRRLRLTGKFRQPLRNLGTVTPLLERFTLHFGFELTPYRLLHGIEWPGGLTHLAVNKSAHLDGISIPSSVSVDYITWCDW